MGRKSERRHKHKHVKRSRSNDKKRSRRRDSPNTSDSESDSDRSAERNHRHGIKHKHDKSAHYERGRSERNVKQESHLESSIDCTSSRTPQFDRQTIETRSTREKTKWEQRNTNTNRTDKMKHYRERSSDRDDGRIRKHDLEGKGARSRETSSNMQFEQVGSGQSHGDSENSQDHNGEPVWDRIRKSSPSEVDYDFDFSQHKLSLNKIFFRDQDYIQRGTQDYDDFWLFAARYQAFQKKKAQRQIGAEESKKAEGGVSSLGIPLTYDNRYRINLSLITKHADDFISRGRLIDADVDEELTVNRVKHFKDILLCYMDFKQKEKLNKLKKIKQDQKNLPIYQYKEMIVKMVQENQVVVVAGDTGCGKSTQVPQYLLEAGFTKIACTQPRRIACISLSKRVGFETLKEYGSEVAYQVRFEKTKNRFTRILFLTEGLLLRQMSTDAELSQYSVIVIDEVHERHIHTDFLLGVLKCLLRSRKDLKLVLMSATININLFSGYFYDAPVVKVPGRLYPIEMEYCPITRDQLGPGKPQRLDPSPYLKVMQRIDHKYPANERGDLLIFLSGMSEIMAVVDAARMYAQQTKRWIILPLHSALSIAEQDKVFDIAPDGVRKCIISTNIAETSVTIDGVRFIIDSGKVKEMSFDPKYKMQRLQEFWISRASAEQRKGRAGRTGPGVCYRLYTETDYDEFQAYSTPEIQRVPIDSLLLQLISMGLPDCRRFPFLEAPSMSSIENSVSFLKEQGALTSDESLTPIGQMLARLPVDVVIGKMLIMGSVFHMIDPVLSIAAAMSVQSPFTSRGHVDHDGSAARKQLESEHGDPFTLLNAFDEWIQVKAEGRGTRKWCKRRSLEEQRFYEMTKLKRQFKDLLQDHGLLKKVSEAQTYYTSEERQRQHGDRKRLGQLKREQRKSSKKRKVLKLEEDDFTISGGEEEDEGADLKDLEFRLSHDLNKLQETSNKSRRFRRRDVNLLKIILCSGLYPQVAISDDCNSFKSDAEQAFHTKSKPFVLLHPTSVFACQPDLLKPQIDVDSEVGQTGASKLEAKMSTKHELLTFVSLLETNKPYLVNIMRVPALQTLLLFSNSLDTNEDCSRVVCDGWLEIRFKNDEPIQDILSSVVKLRQTWHELLQLRLEDTFLNVKEEGEMNPKAIKLERILARKLREFLSSKVAYTLRRIMSAEKERLYRGADNIAQGISEFVKLTPENAECKPHPVKGGIQVNHYLTLNCLLDDVSASVWGEYTSHMQRHWTCPSCNTSMIVSVVERLQHEVECQRTHPGAVIEEDDVREAEMERAKQMNPLKKSYFCADCDKQFDFTSTEILKHKKSHLSTTQTSS